MKEKYYYEQLARFLGNGQLNKFRDLVENSVNYNIFLDMTKIPKRFELISKLLLRYIEELSGSYQTSALGKQIDAMRFCNEFGLLERKLKDKEKNLVDKIKKDKLLLANLKDLFGRVSDSFISYISLGYPRELYNYFMKSPNDYFTDRDVFMEYAKNHFLNQYTIYGLSVRYLSSVKQFIDIFEKNHAVFKTKSGNSQRSRKFLEFNIIYRIYFYEDDETREYRDVKKHFVSPQNIVNIKSKILSEDNYNFYILSMVLLGGLGPQGLGFTYSTPKGEVIEICSDQKETEAIIIKFKQYLTMKFLGKLEEELIDLNMNNLIIKRIIGYLSEVLNQKDLIDYHDKDSILKKIRNFLNRIEELKGTNEFKIEEFFEKISKAVLIILRDIKLKDQFMTRMDLVAKGKLRSEDIAKLTSLKGKSHYDVLRERFFYQYIIDWFYDIYQNEKEKLNEEN
ncbi:MAG: hypothetical protein ACFFFB_06695 [Candidatus Heimdallarchaeota archaeon]